MESGRLVVLGLMALLLLVTLTLATVQGFERTSTTAYCISCHEIRSRLDELEKSVHAVDWSPRRRRPGRLQHRLSEAAIR